MGDAIRFIDLFCGVGGFRIAAQQAGITNCVFSSDIDPYARQTYQANFGDMPAGDITNIPAADVPDHDLLFAGFPCQPFSIIGNGAGFRHSARGTLFFDIARILHEKRPRAFLLENVKRLERHDRGETLRIILETLEELGYFVSYRILNALDFGLPQKRERIFLVGFTYPVQFDWDFSPAPMQPLSALLEANPPLRYTASGHIQTKRRQAHQSPHPVAIWHENKSGNVTSYPYSCALRAGASHNYLLVNGQRRLTPREMFRLQGFPDSFKIVCADSQSRKQAGNSVAVPVVRAILARMLPHLAMEKA